MSIFDDMLKAADDAEKAAAKPAAPVKPAPVAAKPVVDAAENTAVPATPAVTAPAKPVKDAVESIFEKGLAEAAKAEKARAAAAAKAAKVATTVKIEPLKAPEAQPIDWRAMYDASQIHAAKGGEARSLAIFGKRAPAGAALEREEFAPVDVDAATELAAKKLGMSKDKLKETAEIQGVSLDSLYRAAVNKIPYDQVARANRERGVLGFMSPVEREAAATKIANEALRAQRGEADDTPIELRKAGTTAKVDFLGTREKLPEVTREGEHGFGTAKLLVDALKKDPKAAQIYDRYGRLMTGGATAQYVEDRVRDLAQRQSLTPTTPGFDDKIKALRRRAMREVIAYKTVGQWTPIISMSEVEVAEGRKNPDLVDAFKPGVEIIGFDNKNQAIYRQESALSTVFRAVDAPKSAVIEMGREIADKGIEGADLKGAAARGIRSGVSLVEVSQNLTEGMPLPVRIAAGGVGLAADILSPDSIVAGAKALRVAMSLAKGAARATEFAALKSVAARGATKLAQEVVDLAESGDLAGAARKESELRAKFPAVARAADQYDANMARFIAQAYDTRHLDTTLTDDIAAIVPDAESAAGRTGLHASMRFAEQSGKTKGGGRVSVLPYQEAYDVEGQSLRIERDRTRFITQTPAAPETYMERYAGNYTNNLIAPAVRGGAVSTTLANKAQTILKSDMALLRADPVAWGNKIRATIKADADLGLDANKVLRQTLYKKAIPAIQKRGAPVFANYPAWYASQIKLFDDAQEAVAINKQSRITAFKTVVRALDEGGYVDPLPEYTIDILRGKRADSAQPPLSMQGRAFFSDLLSASRRPQVSIEEAYQQAQVVDQAAAAWAKKNSTTVDAYYKRYGLRARRAEAPRVTPTSAVAGAPAVPPAPAAPAAPVAAVKRGAKAKKAKAAAQVPASMVSRADIEPTVEVLEATVPRAEVVEPTMPRAAEAPVRPTVAEEVAATVPSVDPTVAAREAQRQRDAVTATPEFKTWFGDSKVVAPDGRPMVMYHGTAASGFDTFDTYGTNYGLMGVGAYFTDDAVIASSYTEKGARRLGEAATPGVYPVYLSIKNPLDMDAPADLANWRRVLDESKTGTSQDEAFAGVVDSMKPGMTNEQVFRLLERELGDLDYSKGDAALAVTETVQKLGHDGITHIGGGRVRADSARHRVYIAFEPTQIKSAIGNTGAFSPTEPSILLQAGRLTGDAERGAIDLSNKANVIIKLFRGADPSTALHEIGHLLRVTHLDDVDMASISSWLRSRGLNVTHRYGEFVGAPQDVERAEEVFAQAFERYVREGVAPTPDMQLALNDLSTAVAAVYRGVANTPVGQALSPEARALFNKTLTAVDTEREAVRGIAQGQGAVKAMELPEGSLTYLSREAQRLGMPDSTMEDLKAALDVVLPPEPAVLKRAPKTASAPSSTVVFTFPAPVFGKTEYTLGDLAKLDSELQEAATLREATKRPVKIDLRGAGKQAKGDIAAPGEIVEAAPVEKLRAAVLPRADENAFAEGARTLARGAVGLFFGGDVVTERGLRELPEALRRDLTIIPRRIEQALVDTTVLVEDARKSGEIDDLIRYLAGSKNVATRGGRSLVSSGDDMMGGFLGMVRRSFDGLTDAQKQAVIEMTAILNTSDKNRRLAEMGYDLNVPVELRRDAQGKALDTLVEAVTQLLYRPKLGDQNIDIGQSMYESIRQAVGAHPDAPRPNYEFDLVESMLYSAGITSRNGAFIAPGSEEAARVFLKEASTIYEDDAVGRRLAVTIAGYGQAQVAKKRLAGLGLLMDEDTVEAFKAWQVGGAVPVDMLPKVDELVRRVGQNPSFVKDPILDTTFYVPRQARELMADALTKVRMTTTDQNVGEALIRSMLAARKTSVTRGNLVVRPRYFMMNTVDHYNQMAMIAGYGPAMQSVARVIAQDLMVLPVWQQMVGVASRVGVLPPTALEKVRIGLQAAGDRAAWLVGSLFSSAKYRIEVNPILEGSRGTIRLGNAVYERREIRNIAVEEGIFASFSTREFQKTIYAEGELFFNGQSYVTSSGIKLPPGVKQAVGVARDAAYALEDVVRDTAEAWSERERLGAMITLMEQGIPPRAAARLVIDGLFDYSQSLSKADRNMLLGVFFPFWSFQKNANTVVANLMLSSSEGAYRMMCIRRAQEGFAELASELMYGEVGGEYGVDVANLPPDLQETYYSIISDVTATYPGKPIPEDVKSSLRMLFRGRSGVIEDGKEVQLSPELQRLRSSGAFRKFGMGGAVVPRPELSGLPSYLRDLPAITIPLARDAGTRGYLSLLNDDGAYAAMFVPENTIAAGMKHILGVTAGMMSLSASTIDMLKVGDLDVSDASRSMEMFSRAIQPTLDIERTPLPLLMTEMAGVSGGAPGMKLHPWLGQLVQNTFGVSLVRAPAKYDATVAAVLRGETQGIDPKIVAEIIERQKQNPDLATARDERYYLPGGLWTEVLRTVTPGLYELNAFMLKTEETPLEAASRQAHTLWWLRNLTGVTTTEVIPSKTARQEEPTRLKPTKEM